MLKTTLHLQPNRISEAAMNASRQMWLASLGAAVVTRDWVQSEAGDVFKTLVKEGTVVESRAIRFVGDRIETSFSHRELRVEGNPQNRRVDGEAGGRHGREHRAAGAAEVAAGVRIAARTEGRQARGKAREEGDEAHRQGRTESEAHGQGRDEARVMR